MKCTRTVNVFLILLFSLLLFSCDNTAKIPAYNSLEENQQKESNATHNNEEEKNVADDTAENQNDEKSEEMDRENADTENIISAETEITDSNSSETDEETGSDNDASAEGEQDETSGNEVSSIDGQEPLKTIYVHKESVNELFLHYTENGVDWSPLPGKKMTQLQNNWWKYSMATSNPLEFTFNDGKDDWYPGTYNFRTSYPETYIKNGIVFTYNPEKEKPADELVIMTLNLHTYQEENSAEKLYAIADVINTMNPDVVCFQEAAQHRETDFIEDKRAPFQSENDALQKDNMVYIISKYLQDVFGQTTNYYWSWSHYGWDVWKEGVAILTKHKITVPKNRIISTGSDPESIDTRKAVFATIELPEGKKINMFSTHTSFGDDQSPQISALKNMVQEKKENQTLASIICGDFNAPAASDGYEQLIGKESDGDTLVDSYSDANPKGFFDPTFEDLKRIDYIFFSKGDSVETKTSQIYFRNNPNLGGRVSDHSAVISRFRIKK